MSTVFVSYRRGDSEGQARALKNDLVELIGKSSVFMDVDNIAPGQDFRHVLNERLESCGLLLALIGPGWLDAKDGEGNRRLGNATDLVRHEIAAALKRNIRVIPVLLQGVQVPSPERLPEDIRELAYRHAFALGHSTWESDVREMVRRLGLDKQAAVSSAGTRPVKTARLLAALAVIAIVAAVFFFKRAPDQASDTRPSQNGAQASSPQPESSPAPTRESERTAAFPASVSSEPRRGAAVSALEKSSGGSPPGAVSRAFPGESGAANSVSVSPGSRLLAAGYQSGVVKLWDPSNGKTVASLPGQVGSVSALAFSPDNRLLGVTSGDRTVRLWDFAQQKESARLVGHRESVLAVAFSPDGRTVATASADATVRLWDAATGEGRAVFAGHTDWATSVVFSDDGRLVVSGGRDRSVRVWDVERSREQMTIEVDASVWSVAIAAHRNLIAAGTDRGTIVVWDADTGQQKWTTPAHNGTVWGLAFNGKGTLLASGGADSLVKLWDTTSWISSQTFRDHKEWVRSVVFEPAGMWLASASGDGDVRIWRTTKP
jgi:WD40 repeat protein